MFRMAGRSALIVVALSLAPAASPLASQEEDVENREAPGEQAEAAEEAEESEPEAAGESFAEKVTVTARKRGELIGDVPFSIAAPTEEVLRDRGADDLEDVSANVAGFTVQNLGPGQSQVAIRGVSAGQVVRDQPGVKEQVGVYLDESVISLSLFTPDLDLFDMNRIEVLRGPQGTLFGSGSLSGTVRYITNQPQLGVSEESGELAVATIDGGGIGSHAKAVVNVPLGERAATRIAAYYKSYGGYMDAVQPDLGVRDDVNDGDRMGVRWSLLFEPNDRLRITPRVLYQEADLNGWNRIDAYNVLANPFTTTRPAVDLGEREQFTQFEEPYSDEFLLADLEIEADLGGKLLTSVTSLIDRDILVIRDATALTGFFNGAAFGFSEPVYTIDAPLDDATQLDSFTQELRLSGATPRWDWVTGVFYWTMDRDYGQSLFVDGFTDAVFENDPELGELFELPYEGPRAAPDELFFSDLKYDFEQLAFFGEGTYAVNDRLSLSGGLRYYDFDEERTQVFDGFFSPFSSVPGEVTADGFAPRVIASYAVSDDTDLNAQISKGFRLGGINDPLNVPLCSEADLVTFGGRETWEDEELWNYEVGSKTTFMGGRGSFNVAAFYQDISDLQVTVTAGTCSSRVIFNVPEATSAGLEFEVAAQPSPQFDFALSASFTEAELGSTLTSTDDEGNTTILAGIQDGNRLPTVPEFQAAAAAGYRWEMRSGWAGYVNGTYQHVGSRFTQVGDQADGFGSVPLTPAIGGPLTQDTFVFDPELPSYDILNLRVGVLSDRWDITLYANNVTDERAFLALDQEAGTLARVAFLTNQPRTIGVNARLDF